MEFGHNLFCRKSPTYVFNKAASPAPKKSTKKKKSGKNENSGLKKTADPNPPKTKPKKQRAAKKLAVTRSVRFQRILRHHNNIKRQSSDKESIQLLTPTDYEEEVPCQMTAIPPSPITGLKKNKKKKI
jgi:hypothetical protein